MTTSTEDTGVMLALVERFTKQRLPKAIALKAKVDQEERLSEHDIAFLEKIFKEANHITPLIDKHPEWKPIAARAMSLYKEITDKALHNEKQS